MGEHRRWSCWVAGLPSSGTDKSVCATFSLARLHSSANTDGQCGTDTLVCAGAWEKRGISRFFGFPLGGNGFPFGENGFPFGGNGFPPRGGAEAPGRNGLLPRAGGPSGTKVLPERNGFASRGRSSR